MSIPNDTLKDRVLFQHRFAFNKHGPFGFKDGDEYAEHEVNRMSNMELLEAISDAMDDLLTYYQTKS